MNAMEPHLTAQTTPENIPISLIQVLSNTLILYQTTPHLPASSLLALASTSKAFKDLIHKTPNVFRHLNLTKVKGAQFEIAAIDHGGEVWRNVQLDENLTEDESVLSNQCQENLMTILQILWRTSKRHFLHVGSTPSPTRCSNSDP